ncbi:MAG: adenylyltransferase/cytidyltransferase family protein [Acutalibacteraceae bacterium]
MKTVITYGTFDLFHMGHYNILKRAKELGDYLIVGVTSESYDIDRGKLAVHDSLIQRIKNVQATGFADKIIVEEYLGQKVRDIIKYNIDVLVVGSDWIGKFDHLRKYCDVVYLDRTKNISSTQLREKMDSICKIGIMTDNIDDGGCVEEAKYVSGLHAENVFAKDNRIAKDFCDKYELNQYTSDLDEFFSSVNIVYIKVDAEERYDMIKAALKNKKHVICDYPFSTDYEKVKELHELAHNNNSILLENIVMIYLRGFNQLLWMIQSNIIGDILAIDASISSDVFSNVPKSFNELSVYPVCLVAKILGSSYDNVHKHIIKDENGEDVFGSIMMRYGEKIAHIEIGVKTELNNRITIIGEKGTLVVYDDWWNTGYYKIIMNGEKTAKRFSFNFEGNGLRYLIQELLVMINDNRTQCTRLFPEESETIINIINK